MTTHTILSDKVRERASFYALGSLEGAELFEFERHLSGCLICQSEVRAYRSIAGQLGLTSAAPAVDAGKRVVRGNNTSSLHALARATEIPWRRSPFAGVEYKTLYSDRTARTITTLLRAAPGATYPAHRHGGVEQIYVIDGDMIFDDHRLDSGDFEVSAGNTEHSSISTNAGCLALIVHSDSDQFLR
jgi:anti-sigma factor ChrR (cupin superfamily)